MPSSRECPLCGGSMRLIERKLVDRIPGDPKPITRITKEWVCPDCDYFEEAEDEK